MDKMRFRQVHLDFHTSGEIPGIGSRFERGQFQEMLKKGHVDSITIFSKCHHGWAYHPSKANTMHPQLSFDLLGEMISAAHEIGVRTPVYLSAGLDEKLVYIHPEWLRRDANGYPGANGIMQAHYHEFCMNTPYLDYLLEQVREVVENYDADGIFLDIVGERTCYCQYCFDELLKKGLDPADPKNAVEQGRRVYANYTKRINDLIRSIKPDMPIFHNSGHVTRGRRDLADVDTHLELESLPTGGWGYDHFPLSARYAQGLGKEFLGMTGKFHTTWGEFGGYKHPNALRYEAALSIANGAKVSVGDQMHPTGFLDPATYEIIGAAYSEVEQKEAWCRDAQAVADIAMLSCEAASGMDANKGKIDAGCTRILLEGKYLFNVVDTQSDFSKYKLIILPDVIKITPALKAKLDNFLSGGGKLLATGWSGIMDGTEDFAFDFGASRVGINGFKPDYIRPLFKTGQLPAASLIMYGQGQQIALTNGQVLAWRQNSYFNRDWRHFCSHQHTPSALEDSSPGVVLGNDGAYIAWNIFEDYATKGSLICKEVVKAVLDTLLGESKTLSTTLPAQGVVTLMRQPDSSRYVNHLLYASPARRGDGVEVIEDLLDIYGVKVSVKVPETVKKVYLAPDMSEIAFTQKDGVVEYTVDKLNCHAMVVLEY
ncbi:MAG: beta-galactosidase trimerization domain-containing protein [Eubacteriales bacterium]